MLDNGRTEKGLIECKGCRQEIKYCCETTIHESWRTCQKPRVHPQDIYFTYQTKYGFTVNEQRWQLQKQKFHCAFCGTGGRQLIVDKRQATEYGRLRFVCRSCAAAMGKMQRYQDGRVLFKGQK